jgi:hypothetical protein
MELKKADTIRSRLIAHYAEAPPFDELWDDEEERYLIESVDRWKIGIDNATYLEDLYLFIHEELPENEFERKLKLRDFQANMQDVKEFFWEQGILLVCERKNSNRSTLYYLSEEIPQWIREGTRNIDKVNNGLNKIKDTKIAIGSKSAKTKSLKLQRQQYIGIRLPSRIKYLH